MPQGAETTRAQTLLEMGRAEEALTLLESALRHDPEDVEALCLRAGAILHMGRAEEAVRAAEEAAAASPEEEWPHRIRALALHAARRHKEAVKSARRAAELEPELAEPQIALATCEAAVHRLPAARAAAERAVALDPESSDTHLALGEVALDQGDKALAERAFRKALELNPEDPAAMNNLAVVLTRTGRREEAMPLLEGAVRLDPRQDLSRENALGTARDILTGGGWLIPIVVFIAFRIISYATDRGASTAVVVAIVLVVGVVSIMLYQRAQMSRLTPTARALLRDERRRALRRPWTWRPQYIYLPWPVLVAQKIPSPIWLAGLLVALVLLLAESSDYGYGEWIATGAVAAVTVYAALRSRRWLLRRGAL